VTCFKAVTEGDSTTTHWAIWFECCFKSSIKTTGKLLLWFSN